MSNNLMLTNKDDAFKDFWLYIKKDKADWQRPECPRCGETKKLRIRIDTHGNADAVECYADGCGWEDYSSHLSRMLRVEI